MRILIRWGDTYESTQERPNGSVNMVLPLRHEDHAEQTRERGAGVNFCATLREARFAFLFSVQHGGRQRPWSHRITVLASVVWSIILKSPRYLEHIVDDIGHDLYVLRAFSLVVPTHGQACVLLWW